LVGLRRALYKGSIPIGELYLDFVTCDVVDMDNCHILLERPWQHDIDATRKGEENIYTFTWKGKRVIMRPISLTSKSTKEKASELVSM